MNEPQYHKQPITMDPSKEPPDEDAPLAQGHLDDDDVAGRVRDAMAEHKETVEAEADQDEVGPRDAGDHAGETETSDDEVPEGSINDVMSWVGDDPDRAQRALDAERAGLNRTTLIAQLEAITNA